MHKRLMDSNHLLARNNDEGSNLVHEVINLVEPQSWNIEITELYFISFFIHVHTYR